MTDHSSKVLLRDRRISRGDTKDCQFLQSAIHSAIIALWSLRIGTLGLRLRFIIYVYIRMCIFEFSEIVLRIPALSAILWIERGEPYV